MTAKMFSPIAASIHYVDEGFFLQTVLVGRQIQVWEWDVPEGSKPEIVAATNAARVVASAWYDEDATWHVGHVGPDVSTDWNPRALPELLKAVETLTARDPELAMLED